jgi:hypothetical protein
MAKNQEQRREAPKPTPMPQRREEPRTTLGQGIRAAGADGITKKELNFIADTTGKSSSQIIQKLDQVNKNLKSNDKTGINLGAAASNMLIREASKQSPTGYNTYLSSIMGPAMGTGRLGTELQRRATEFGTTGSMGSLIPRGMSAMPSGRLTVSGVGKQFELPKTKILNPIDLETGGNRPPGGNNTGGNNTDVEPTVEEVAPTTIDTQAPEMLGIGADLSNWATGFRRKGSSRRGAGARAQGLGSQRVNPTGSFRGGM